MSKGLEDEHCQVVANAKVSTIKLEVLEETLPHELNVAAKKAMEDFKSLK